MHLPGCSLPTLTPEAVEVFQYEYRNFRWLATYNQWLAKSQSHQQGIRALSSEDIGHT